MKSKFLGQAYRSRSPVLASQTAINIYAESSESNSDEVGAFYGTPGLLGRFTSTGQVRGLHDGTDGNLYAVIGNTCWRISTGFQGTNLGTIPNSSGPVSIVDNGVQVAFAHSAGWHFVAFTGSAIAPVANSPTNSILTASDSYVAFTTSNDGTFGITALDDLSSIDPLDIATAEGLPDSLNSIVAVDRELVLLGDDSTEIWQDTGAALFPFERTPGGFIEQGCAAARSPRKLDNSVFWIGRDENGQGVVYRSQGYIPQRISTHAVEFAINQYATISDAIGVSYQEEGHAFYWLIFPSGNASWCYDVATGGWHQRLFLNDAGTLDRPRANCYAFFNGLHLVGDWQNGTIYQMSLQTYTDDGRDIYRERAWDLPDNENKKSRVDFVELKCLTGDEQEIAIQAAFQAGAFQPGAFQSSTVGLFPPMVWLQCSRDGGRRWGYQRNKPLSKTGQTMARVRWRRPVSGRDIVLRVGTTMANRVQWVDANIRGEPLDQ